MQSLTQTHFFRTTKFTITPDGLEVNFKSLTRRSTEIIPFEEIGSILGQEKTINPLAFRITMGLFAFSLFRYFLSFSLDDSSFLFLFSFACIGGIVVFLTFTKSLTLSAPGLRVIPFKPDSPSKEKVKMFIDELINKRNQVLIMKFGNISRKLPYETQHERILWLNGIGVFSNLEVEEKKKELNFIFGSDGGKYDITLN